MDLARFRKLPILGIIRTMSDIKVEPLVEAVAVSGLQALEIAMNSARAGSLIERAVKSAGAGLMVGAGTVLDMDTLKEALDAGASFIVMPVLKEDVVGYCAKHRIPVFPGAFSPQEIYNAWNAGATMVKVFPAAMFGPSYIKEIKAPFPDIELLACGGVAPGNIKAYFDSGANAVAFGASIFRNDLIGRGDFAGVKDAIMTLIAASR